VESGAASRKPGEIADNGPRELEFGEKTCRMKGRRTSARLHGERATESDDEEDQITIRDVTFSASGHDG
jgi:hypothetical protein